MTPERFVQSFTDPDSGEVESITTEPLEFWTATGWEIIPAGFRVRFYGLPFIRLDQEENLLCLLYEWRRTAKRTPRHAAVRLLWRNLIKYTQCKKNGNTGHFWAKLKDRARTAAICLLAAIKM